jgi:glycosyltransferase involved in cell wall biosynthesis
MSAVQQRPLRILMVGSGSSPIPPPGWGAVALLIGQTRDYLVECGHTCDILNKKHWRIANAVRARPWTYDFVHLHAERRAKLWVTLSRVLKFKIVITTYGSYAAFPERWKPRYRRIFRHLCGAPYLIALSREIAHAARREGFRNEILTVPSAIQCAEFRFDAARAKKEQACVLGRVEERKKQAYLARVLAGHDVPCDFIGPYKNSDVSAIAASPNMRLLGPWKRAQVQQDLTDYACSILLSDGEAHPLAVMESMASGLSIVVSPEASHNLDPARRSSHRGPRQRRAVANAVETAVRDNHKYRNDVRRYCEENFDWSVVGPKYVRAAREMHDDAATGGKTMSQRAVVIIPARLAATRLPNKPLADIAGKQMISTFTSGRAGRAHHDVLVATPTRRLRGRARVRGRVVLTSPTIRRARTASPRPPAFCRPTFP